MNVVNKVKVTICGKEHSLQTDESPDYIVTLAKKVEHEISSLMKTNPGYGLQSAAVFVALASLDEAAKASESVVNISKQIKIYVDDAAKTRAAKDKLAEKVKSLEARISELENENKELEKANKELDKANKELDKANKELDKSVKELEKENKELKKRPPIYDDCEQLVLENTITPAVTVLAEAPKAAAEDKSESKPEDKQADKSEGKSEDKQEGKSEDKPGEKSSAGSASSTGQDTAEPEHKGSDGGTAAEAANDGDNTQNVDLTSDGGRKNKKKKR